MQHAMNEVKINRLLLAIAKGNSYTPTLVGKKNYIGSYEVQKSKINNRLLV